MPTRMAEALGVGIDDVRYMQKLEDLIAIGNERLAEKSSTHASGMNEELKQAISDAEATIEEIISSVQYANNSVLLAYHINLTPEVQSSHRESLAMAIEKLSSLLGSP